MREIRSRISERNGIELTNQQVQELAARRLEAILDPRAIKPSLMDELRRASGLPADAAPPEPDGEESLDESALYATDSGFVRFMRRLLNPLLKLFFEPAVVVDALNNLSARNKAGAARESEQRRRQTEWNALHFEILRRVVTDLSRAEIENQHLAQRVESLSAKVDFNERRVRGFEQTQQQSRPAPVVRPSEFVPPTAPPPAPREEAPSSEQASAGDPASPEGTRRRRRRRRGRRSGQPRDITGAPIAGAAGAVTMDQSVDPSIEGEDLGDEEITQDELTDDVSVASMLADEPAVVDLEPASSVSFEPPAHHQEEPATIASSELEQRPPVAESAAAPEPAEPVVRPDPVTPEQS